MMNKVQFLVSACIVFFCSGITGGDTSPRGMPVKQPNQGINEGDQTNSTHKAGKKDSDSTAQDDPQLLKAVEEALKSLQKDSPQVNEDSLRIWKNFKSNSKPVNYTYRFWARRLILWLKEEKNITFDTEKKVGDVFNILYHKGLISANAVLVLTVDVWSHLVYLEGSPDWEKRLENRRPEGGATPSTLSKNNASERSV